MSTLPYHDRREFLGHLATAAVALAGTACAAPLVSQQPASTPAPAPKPTAPHPMHWDLSWIDRITGTHRAVFDSPALEDGTALNNAYLWLSGFHDVYHTTDADMNAVIVMRHRGVPMAFDDELWDRYEIGKELKIVDPTTGKPARRNPWRHVQASDTHADVFPEGSLDALQARGTIFLACNLAAMGAASRMAHARHLDVDTVQADVRAHLVQGATLVPSGIFGVMRAQEAGCHYMRSSV